MILEVAFLVVLLLIASLYAGYGGFRWKRRVEVPFVFDDVEGFASSRDNHTLGKCAEDTIDLRTERDKLLQRLTEVQQETHGDPENATKASVRVGLERMIAEIDRALEEEGRCVPPATVEAVIRASNRTFRPN